MTRLQLRSFCFSFVSPILCHTCKPLNLFRNFQMMDNLNSLSLHKTPVFCWLEQGKQHLAPHFGELNASFQPHYTWSRMCFPLFEFGLTFLCRWQNTRVGAYNVSYFLGISLSSLLHWVKGVIKKCV